MKTILLVVILVAVTGLIIQKRRQVGTALVTAMGYLRLTISPEWNNRIFLALCAISTILFFNAIYQGGGEPLGLRALRQVANEAAEQTKINRYYGASTKYFVTGSEKTVTPPVKSKISQPTWFWWKLWFTSFLLAVGFIPLAFWDEVRDAWRQAKEATEQRRVVIDLRPPQSIEGGEHRGQGSPLNEPINWWQRFRERVFAGASANALYEFIEGIARRILTERILRRVK